MPVPDPREQHLVQFYIAKSLPYRLRVVLIFVLLLFGTALEVFLPFPLAIIGVCFFAASGLLFATVGFSNAPASSGSEGFWKTTEIDRLQQIHDLCRRTKKWDTSSLDISNVLGFFTFIVMAALTIFLGIIAQAFRPDGGFILVCASAGCLILPIWFTGMRLGHTNNRMYQKMRTLLDVARQLHPMLQQGEDLKCSLQLSGEGDNTIPMDAKIQITWKNAHPDFYGVQCQVNLNDVQGRLYPYCYFVAVAKRPMEIFQFSQGLELPGSITVETRTQSDVHVIIIRGHTTKKSGYHTEAPKIRMLMERAVHCGRQIAYQYPAR